MIIISRGGGSSGGGGGAGAGGRWPLRYRSRSISRCTMPQTIRASAVVANTGNDECTALYFVINYQNRTAAVHKSCFFRGCSLCFVTVRGESTESSLIPSVVWIAVHEEPSTCGWERKIDFKCFAFLVSKHPNALRFFFLLRLMI